MLVVGLTGGIGSGKSTVAERLAGHGAAVIDADRVAREVVEPGEPALTEIAERFGDEVIADDGTLRRDVVAGIVFGDDDARADLEAITHPRIGDRILHRLDRLEAEGAPVVVLDHPLLVETGMAEDLAVVIVVTAPEDVRVERLVAQRGMDRDDAEARIAAQATDRHRREAATHVIDNSGDLDDLARQVDEVWEDLSARVAAS